ncbi:hypothetical protein [Qipengyuania nanhaisediminis]|uniref:hypothetical protein n=1 Tax=Qipengyuania nanhaisediminis TaxID=604088 RepID=UPI0038B23413
MNTYLPSAIVAKEARLSDNQMTHFRQLAETDENMAAVLPGKPEVTGKARLFDPTQAALACIMADFIALDVKAPLAARIARRIMEARERQPQVEQWSVIVTENVNVSTLPFGQTELRTGFISGSRLRFAVVIDWRNYADRIERAIADAPRVIGGGDGE